MNILVAGAGIAGPTLAFWLREYGFTPTLLEHAPALRTGGYVVDFWGGGFDVAERMGLLPSLERIGYRVREVRTVDRESRVISVIPTTIFDGLMGGRFISLPRGDLSARILGLLEGRVELRLGDTITSLEERADGVRVQFAKAPPRTFDAVIGADGLHSGVRALVFGPQRQFERYLGYQVAAFEAPGYAQRDELAYLMHVEVGRMVGRFTLRGNRTLFLFVYRDDDPGGGELSGPREQKAALHRRFADGGWECSRILEALDACDALYFDRVSQIEMPRWSRGRVALVGDAAACVSLMAGQGTALAMVEAYVLAGELKAAAGDPGRAFERYESRLQPLLASKQQAGRRFAGSFAPKTALSLFVRNQVSRLMSFPAVARLAIGRSLTDRFPLPDY